MKPRELQLQIGARHAVSRRFENNGIARILIKLALVKTFAL